MGAIDQQLNFSGGLSILKIVVFINLKLYYSSASSAHGKGYADDIRLFPTGLHWARIKQHSQIFLLKIRLESILLETLQKGIGATLSLLLGESGRVLIQDVHLLLDSLSGPNEVLLVSLLLFLLDFLKSLLLNSLVFILLLFKVDFYGGVKAFFYAFAVAFVFALDQGLNIPMLLLLHHIKYLLTLIFHADFIFIRNLNVSLHGIDEFLNKGIGALMVLVASTHLHHWFCKLSFLWHVSIINSTFVHLVFLLLVQPRPLLALAASAHKGRKFFFSGGED